MSSTTVFIAGLTGKFARKLAGHLLAKPNIRIHGTARSPSKLPAEISSNPRVTVFQADADDLTIIRQALNGSSVAICCYLGDQDLMLEGQKKLIDASIEEGVPRYVAGDWSLDFRNLKYGEVPMKDPMKKITEYLDERKDQISGVHILNGEFMEILFAFSGLYDAKNTTFNYWGSGDEKLDLTTYDDSARYTAEIALDQSANGFIEVLGDSISIKDAAVAYREVYNVDPKTQRLGSLDDLHDRLIATRNAQPQNVYAWMGFNYNLVMLNGSTSLRNVVNSRFPDIRPTTVRDFFQNHKRQDLPKVVHGL